MGYEINKYNIIFILINGGWKERRKADMRRQKNVANKNLSKMKTYV